MNFFYCYLHQSTILTHGLNNKEHQKCIHYRFRYEPLFRMLIDLNIESCTEAPSILKTNITNCRRKALPSSMQCHMHHIWPYKNIIRLPKCAFLCQRLCNAAYGHCPGVCVQALSSSPFVHPPSTTALRRAGAGLC